MVAWIQSESYYCVWAGLPNRRAPVVQQSVLSVRLCSTTKLPCSALLSLRTHTHTQNRKLAGLGVPVLRTLFSQVFGQETASNNAAWLRRKLAEAPDSVHGQRRSPVVRARDQGAAIWNQGDDPALADHECGDHHHHHQQQNYQEGGTFAAGSMSLTSMQEPAEVSLQQQMQLDGVASGMDSLMMRAANTGTTPAAPAPGSPARKSLLLAFGTSGMGCS